MIFKDESGEIQAVAFLQSTSKLNNMLQQGALYQISNATLKKAYKSRNDVYEMHFHQNTEVTLLPI